MFLQQLEVTGFRNLKTPRLKFDPHFNAFWGENGSGKTSILEAIHVLGVGRSFRTANLQRVIQETKNSYALGGIVAAWGGAEETIVSVGTEKCLNGGKRFRLAESPCSPADVARLLPLQAITVDSHKLLDSGPERRRQFVDWAMFHVEHSFLQAWKDFKQGLLQRNAVLKQGGSRSQVFSLLSAWQPGFVAAALSVDKARKTFVQAFTPILKNTVGGWLPDKEIDLSYKQGWSEDLEFRQALEGGLALDLQQGVTRRGPQRAEVEVLVDGVPAKDRLSRGQQKLLVCAMLFARAKLLAENRQIKSIFLLDDFNSELDANSSNFLLQGLAALECQVFVTNIEREPLNRSFSAMRATKGSFFRVQAGEVSLAS